jgi:hypothetical protein
MGVARDTHGTVKQFRQNASKKSEGMWNDNIKTDLNYIGYECVVGFIWLRICSNGSEP